ncbi:plasmid stabilization protein [Peribacillus castrilensis]|uniref:hypothetical protein n=1 Tax=Bacillaceae TaxID=186817 RepID=UPI00065FDBCB|nr:MULTISPECIES: hypothetical protein [Bacillaceae]MCT1390122.1 plasmid stabilization protein [Peribacillus frigoritolerans]NCT39991.1 plasmid stabilization protein [Peribacillus frigoritolerans]PRA81598.1 plasmid stabilization protein [Peribacillus simplex]
MPHLISLTGKPTGKLRKSRVGFSFDLEEAGAADAPKGLPKSKKITYTVFMNQKQFNKLGVTQGEFHQHRYVVDGEPYLDFSIEDCPGEIGVITFTINLIPEKLKKDQIYPEGTVAIIPMNAIKIPQEFKQNPPKEEKIEQIIAFYKEHQMIDKPILVTRNGFKLVDGYTRYMTLRKLTQQKAPVSFEV